MLSSRDVLIQTDMMDKAVDFYEKILGLKIIKQSKQLVGFETGAFCLYLNEGKPYGPVFEFFVPNLEIAKQTLIQTGCKVEIEDPNVPCCYVRDPFGLIFNLAERKEI